MYRIFAAAVIPLAVVLAFLASYRQPFAPLLWDPADGSTHANNVAQTFKWRYGGQVLQSPFFYRRATHFVVCVQEFTTTNDMICGYQQQVTPSYHFVAPIADFSSTSAAPGTGWAESIRYFTHTVDQLPPDLRDKELMWTAAACSSASRCTDAIPAYRFRRVLPVNLVMAGWEDNLISGNTTFIANVKNEGPDEAVGVTVRFQTGEVRVDAAGRADKDLANADPNDRILTKRGEVRQVAGYTGTRNDIKGILTANAQAPMLELDTMPSTLGVDEIGVAEGSIPLSSFSLPPSSQSIRIMWVAIADPDNDIPEYNEDDNFGSDGIPYTSP